jgi:hypothetical protein
MFTFDVGVSSQCGAPLAGARGDAVASNDDCDPLSSGGILIENGHPIREDLGSTMQSDERNQAAFWCEERA